MSAFLYGKLIRQQELSRASAAAAEENKLVTTVAALIPAEIIAFHGLILSKTTTTIGGVTTITAPVPLKWSLFLFVILAAVVYASGRGWKNLKPDDFKRAAIASGAVLAWTGIIGTSALTPWVSSFDPAWVVLVAGTLGLLLVLASQKIKPPA